jgi:hypothetical protein
MLYVESFFALGLLKSQSSSSLSNSSQIIDDRCMDDANRKARRWKGNARENICRQNICQQMIYVNKLDGYAENETCDKFFVILKVLCPV